MREALTDIVWPEGVLGCPLRRAYRKEVAARFIFSDQTDGPTNFRAQKLEEQSTHTLEFIWTLQQLRIWESFLENDLLGGMRWFRMTILNEMYCHLDDKISISPLDDNLEYYRVSMSIRVVAKVLEP